MYRAGGPAITPLKRMFRVCTGLKAYTFLLPCMYKYIFLEYLETHVQEEGEGRGLDMYVIDECMNINQAC